MSIAALPSQTVRAIGSAQALTDSASVVKELIDNALDAQSTSISIEISANALDILHVTDNGYGIAPIDRSLVCKRYCTSKIKDLDDLANIGGSSLGFRGEALASVVEMSGAVTITTRIVGEATAVCLKVSQNGEVANEDRVSHAVGTTVRINDFLKTIPVRRQTAIKQSTKQLAKIKRTLHAYALARPAVRLGLKILKAKSDKGNWIYAPKADASVSDAAVKVVGKKVSDHCQWVVWSKNSRDTTEDITDISIASKSQHRFEALVPTSSADPSAISNIGQYISVDSRPVSCTRGTLKEIVQLYKSYIRSATGTSTNQKITDPFLCMNLICPPRSYDANVEPAKDDVLFTDSPGVLEMAEAFFKRYYGGLQVQSKPTINSKPTTLGPRNFDLLLARKPLQTAERPSPSVSKHGGSLVPSISSPTARPASRTAAAGAVPAAHLEPDEEIIDQIGGVRRRAEDATSEAPELFPIRPSDETGQLGRQSMYPDEDFYENTNVDGASPRQDLEDEEELRDVRLSNPWTFAKLNAPLHHPKQPANNSVAGVCSNQQLLTPAKQHGSLGQDLSSPDFHIGPITDLDLPTPARSQNGTSYVSSSPETFPYPIKRWGKAQEADARRESSSSEAQSSPTRLDTWIQRPLLGSEVPSQESSLMREDIVLPRPHRDFIPASELSQGTPLNAIPDISQAPRRKAGPRKQHPSNSNGANKPFKPPAVHDPSRVWFDGLPSSAAQPRQSPKAKDNLLPSRRLDHRTANLEDEPIEDDANISLEQQHQQHPGLALTMDYEARKAAVTAQRRAFLREQSKLSVRPPTSGYETQQQSTQIKISPSQRSQSSMPPSSSSPHRNRYNSAIAALHTPATSSAAADASTASDPARDANNNTDLETTTASSQMHPSDPRAHLIRTLATASPTTNLTLLPLETLSRPDEGGTSIRHLTLIIPSCPLLTHLPARVRRCGRGDRYIAGDDDESGAFEDGEMVGRWEGRVREMVEGRGVSSERRH